MNFLAHFLLTDEADPPEYQLGTLLPDIAKRAGIVVKPGDLAENREIFQALSYGMALHWKADRIFHNSTLFKTGVSLWKEVLLGRISPQINKTFFLYHLLLEMWMDKLLMTRYPQADVLMYKRLETVDAGLLARFTSICFGDREGKIVRAFQGFMKRRFVSHYRQADHFAQIATDVFGHVTHQPIVPELKDQIVIGLELLRAEEESVLRAWVDLKEEIRKE